MADPITEKLRRIRGGEAPRVLDLFAGCGGISLGMHRAGAHVVGGVELDPIAARTHALNFHRVRDVEQVHPHSRARDITKEDPLRLVSEFAETDAPRSEIDVLVGGPPCQAFARVGRAKLREIVEHPEAFLHDDRAGLFRDYIRFVEALRPVALLVENVPDVLNFGGVNIFEIMSAALEELGYESRYALLNAVHYGTPQMRERCFLVAVHRRADVVPDFPLPTHRHELPAGYRGSRDVALRMIDMYEGAHYREVTRAAARGQPAVTAEQAIGDLPRLTAHLERALTKGARRFDAAIPLPHAPAPTPFARSMREWPGFSSDGYVRDHVIRHLPRDYRIFAKMRPGDQYPEAFAIANRIRDAAVARLERGERRSVLPGSKEYAELTARFVPPYDPGKFPNKWRKMEADQPARTLMAHLGKDTYSHIHYDDSQARTISVREAARLQSFPDGFVFCGTMNPAFRQVGNAVPPLLAFALATRLFADLGCSDSTSARKSPVAI